MIKSLGKRMFKNRIVKAVKERSNADVKKIALYKLSDQNNVILAWFYSEIFNGRVKRESEELSAEHSEKLSELFEVTAAEAKKEFDSIELIVCNLDIAGSDDHIQIFGKKAGTKFTRKIIF